MSELLSINPENPQERKLAQAADILKGGGIVIYPTDTVYAAGCDLYNVKAMNRLARMKEGKPSAIMFSLICYDLSDISTYARVSTQAFKLMKKALPGPFTFIMDASSKVPKIFDAKKKQVGIRVPAHNIPRELVRLLGNPILTTSIKDEDEVLEYSTDPGLIFEKHKHWVDAVIDGGPGRLTASTIVDCTDDAFEVIRQGLGDLDAFL